VIFFGGDSDHEVPLRPVPGCFRVARQIQNGIIYRSKSLFVKTAVGSFLD